LLPDASLTVVGSINLDLVTRVERLPRPGETLSGATLERVPGGKGANQAVAAARLGAKVRLVGAVGRDPIAEEALAWLRAAGVQLDAREVDAPTGVAIILVAEDGENVIVVVPGANAHVGGFAVDGNVLCQLEIPDDAVKEARAQAKWLCVNAAPARPLVVEAELVVVNRYEAEVVGPQPLLDRLVLVNTESVWFVHEGNVTDPEELKVIEDERQVTVLLVQYASPLAAVSLPRKINTETNMQAASPAFESARLFRMIGVGADVIRAFGGVVLATAALSLFIALYHALNERAYDIAVLRTLGAHPATIAVMVMLEALMLAILGSALGLLLAHGLVALLVWWMAQQESLRISAWAFSPGELWLLVPAFLAAALAALLPSWRAARANISATLARRT